LIALRWPEGKGNRGLSKEKETKPRPKALQRSEEKTTTEGKDIFGSGGGELSKRLA